jgi:hypothetical protein
MNTNKVSRRLMSKLQRTLLAVLMVIVVFGTLPTREAAAWTVSTYSGTPGNNTSLPLVFLGDITQAYGGTYFHVRSSESGIVAVRSQAYAGDQTIKVVYVLEQSVVDSMGRPSWQTVPNQWQAYNLSIGRSYYAFFPVVSLAIPVNYSGYFRVRYSVAWYITNGGLLGSVQIVPDQALDFSCVYSSSRWCQSYPGFFRIGKYGNYSW